MAVLVHRYNAKALLSITGDYTGLGSTGDTVLGVRRNGVETREQLAYLKKRGCDYAQDYLFAKPMP